LSIKTEASPHLVLSAFFSSLPDLEMKFPIGRSENLSQKWNTLASDKSLDEKEKEYKKSNSNPPEPENEASSSH